MVDHTPEQLEFALPQLLTPQKGEQKLEKNQKFLVIVIINPDCVGMRISRVADIALKSKTWKIGFNVIVSTWR